MNPELAVLQTVRLLRHVGKEYKHLEKKNNKGALSDAEASRFHTLQDGLLQVKSIVGDPPDKISFAMNINLINSILCSLM